jgi:hypothetical protein
VPGLRWLMGPKKAQYTEYHGSDRDGRKTMVVEFEGVKHRDIIRAKVHLDFVMHQIGVLSGRTPHDTTWMDKESGEPDPATPTRPEDELPTASPPRTPDSDAVRSASSELDTPGTRAAGGEPAIACAEVADSTGLDDISNAELQTKAKLLQVHLGSLQQRMEDIQDELTAYRAESERRHAGSCAQ